MDNMINISVTLMIASFPTESSRQTVSLKEKYDQGLQYMYLPFFLHLLGTMVKLHCLNFSLFKAMFGGVQILQFFSVL